MKNKLEFDSLYLEFGMNRVLQDIYVQCETGTITGILGRNGSGKSCLMKIVFGTLKAYQQSVRINGVNITNNNIRKGYINYLPQEGFIPGYLKVSDVFTHYNVDIHTFLSIFPECEKIRHSRIETISGGELRLIEVYIILYSQSVFTILDEPFSYLIPLHIEKVISIINEVKQWKGIIITDHLYNHILPISDTLYLLTNGKTRVEKEEQELIHYGYLPEGRFK